MAAVTGLRTENSRYRTASGAPATPNGTFLVLPRSYNINVTEAYLRYFWRVPARRLKLGL